MRMNPSGGLHIRIRHYSSIPSFLKERYSSQVYATDAFLIEDYLQMVHNNNNICGILSIPQATEYASFI